MKKSSVLSHILKSLLGLVSAVLLVVIIYLCYVIFSYSRIDDNLALSIEGSTKTDGAKLDTAYTAVCQNIGFGAYTPDFTFFMDGGKQSRAKSADSVKASVNAACDSVQSLNPDLVLFQEVDLDSTRSHHINQKDIISERFSSYCLASAINYHSAYLFYPISEPHGASNSAQITYSRFNISSAIRRSLPISTSFSKFLDLDRCYSKSRIKTENGKELIVYNVHMSAYGGSDEIRTAQMSMLFNDMKSEYDKGNYTLCGGDFNHDFTGTSTADLNGGGEVDFGWAQPFPHNLLPDGISRCTNYKTKNVPTCRNCDIPYEKGNFTIIVDGFLVSDNIEVLQTENISTDFAYSDHNPVSLKFSLKST